MDGRMDGRTDGQTDRQKISPFYRTSSSIGAAAQKEEEEGGKDMNIQTKSKKGMGDRSWDRKREGEDWQKGEGAPHLVCALGPSTWVSGPD